MLKKTLLVFTVLAAPVLIFAAGDMIDKTSDTYQTIKYLVDAKVITTPLDKEQLSRRDAAAYTNNAVTNLLGDATGGLATNENIDKVFDLVKQLQTDMLEAGEKLSAIEQKLIDLKLREEQNKEKQLEEKQDKLLSKIGLRINGDAGAYMTDLLLYGNNSTYAGAAPKRFRPITEYINLDFNLRALKGLSMDAVFRLEEVFGGFWGSQSIAVTKRISIDGDYRIKFSIGDFQAKLTPYTIWAVDDERPNESKVFSDKRDMNKAELYLADNSWPVTGGKASTTINLFGPDVSFDIMAAKLVSANFSNYSVIPGLSQSNTAIISYPHDQYMGAGRISSEILKDILKLGVNFVEIKDMKDTGKVYGNPVLDNYVGSADAEVNVMGLVKIKGEFAASNYYSGSDSDLSWQNRYISDTAFRIAAETEYGNTKLEAAFFVNGNSFTAYAAQTRMYDDTNNFPYVTQNNTWSASLAYTPYSVSGFIYPFTRYNPEIVASYYSAGHNLIPYIVYENNAMPYGDATPNRQGLIIKLSGKYFDDILIPYFKYSYLEEIISYLPLPVSAYFARTFVNAEGGAKLKFWDFILSGGYKHEHTYNNAPTGDDVNLNSGIMDLGIEYRPDKKWVLAAGYRNIAFSGSEFPYTYNGSAWDYLSRQEYDENIASYGVGIDYQFVSAATIGMSYTSTVIKDNKINANSFNAQEIDAKIAGKF
jgi:hypothetical protein